jgi:hypothetical protein
MDDKDLSNLITLAAAVVFVISGWAALWIWRARRSGWARLAAVYGAKVSEGRARRFQSVRLLPSRVKYARIINVKTTMDGLQLYPVLLTRFGHEPLLVPWGDIEIFAVETYPADRLYDLRFAAEPQMRMRVGVPVAQAIRRAADNAQYFAEPIPVKPPAAQAIAPKQSPVPHETTAA